MSGWVRLTPKRTRKHMLRARRWSKASTKRALMRGDRYAARMGYDGPVTIGRGMHREALVMAKRRLPDGGRAMITLWVIDDHHLDDGSACLHCPADEAEVPPNRGDCGHIGIPF